MKINGKEYPLRDDHRLHYARIAKPVEPRDVNQTVVPLVVGEWVAVDVHLTGGYTISPAIISQKNEAACKQACDIHNKYHGWSTEDVNAIIHISMGNLTHHDGKIGEL